ncbi:MAG: dephospho-CoA kinase [Lachnospiraceae bacterium]|nr:dephospho-CoA kinase [Lachnospiraceae bacterium]
MEKMLKIGVTGGVGAGKSLVLSYLKEHHGARIIMLDEVGRELMQPDGACFKPVVNLFGTDVVKPDGTLDRPLIAKRMLADDDLRIKLNGIIHPAVLHETMNRIYRAEDAGVRLLVVESAILLETNYGAICDEVWYIYADVKVRAARLRASRGYDDARIRKTMEAQLSDEEFRKRADHVIDNSGDFELTRGQIDRVLAAHGEI